MHYHAKVLHLNPSPAKTISDWLNGINKVNYLRKPKELFHEKFGHPLHFIYFPV
jgi:phenylalanine-4-hydroxylase